MENNTNSSMENTMEATMATPKPAGHQLSPNDPENPMRWPLWKKLYTSFASFAFAFTVVYGITTYTAGISDVIKTYNVSMHLAIFGFTIPFLGIAFAPIYTPHVSEKIGRRPIYFVSLFLFSLFILGMGFANSMSTIIILRFFAGFFGGPCLVLIEGTFADVWSAQKTVSYYAFLTLASYWGAGFGPIIGGFVFASKGFAWLQWVTLFFAVFTLMFSAGMPETYGREILRRRIRRENSGIKLAAAQSGETLGAMAHVTILTPLKMMVTEPIVIGMCLYLGLNFAVVFQWFITVPAVLSMVYDFDIQRIGLAFLSAVGGVSLAALTSVAFDNLASQKQDKHGMAPLETRLYPAMLGSLLVVASLFWVGFSASPQISYFAPIFGTAIYVWGNASILISAISYLFDAYPPAGTLAALTVVASFRLVCASIVPIFILDMITNLTGAWALGAFGFISIAMMPFPFLLYFFGPSLRANSRYADKGMSPMEGEKAAGENMMPAEIQV